MKATKYIDKADDGDFLKNQTDLNLLEPQSSVFFFYVFLKFLTTPKIGKSGVSFVFATHRDSQEKIYFTPNQATQEQLYLYNGIEHM